MTAARIALVLLACLHGQPSLAQVPGGASTWQSMPAELGPTGEGAGEGGDAPTTYLPGYGYVRGTPEAMRGIYAPLPEAPGRNVAVDPCRDAVEREAVPLGAIRVEASSAGPQAKVAPGVVEAPVNVRVTYGRQGKGPDYEVRVAVLSCRVGRRGDLIAAVPRAPEPAAR